MQQFFRSLNKLNEMVSDTLKAAGSDAFSTALTICNSAKMAATNVIPGMEFTEWANEKRPAVIVAFSLIGFMIYIL